jgi:diacylglycerol kinase
MPTRTPPPKPGTDPLPLRGLRASFAYAWAGVLFAWKSQRNFRLEVYIGGLALGLAWWLGVNPIPVLQLIALVLGLELINTALEAVVDLAQLSPAGQSRQGRSRGRGADSERNCGHNRGFAVFSAACEPLGAVVNSRLVAYGLPFQI